MKVGDLVKDWDTGQIGIAVEVFKYGTVPTAIRVLWEDGTMGKEWEDELERINGEV